jgi:hypothetical protein
LVSVPFNYKDRRDTHSKTNNFAHVIKYFAKQTKDFNNLIFTGEMEKIVGNYIKNHMRKVNEYRHMNFDSYNIYNQSIFEDVDESDDNFSQFSDSFGYTLDKSNLGKILKTNEKLTEFFEIIGSTNSIYLKDIKDNIKYIMELKLLIENKAEISRKVNTDFPNRTIYFRPEFIEKYNREIIKLDISEKDCDGEKNNFIIYLKKYLFIDDNFSLNAQAVHTMTNWFKDNHIFLFINCLDSLYFKPYDSETLSEAFHSYGINMFFLGLVCEMTSVPHIREICLIDMIARVCKKIIFDLLSSKIMEKANEDYYLGINDHLKSSYEFDPTSQSEPYLPYVPVLFYLKYHKEYLRKVHILNNSNLREFIMSYYEDQNRDRQKEIRGLYKKFWSKCVLNNDKDIKTIFSSSKNEDKSLKPDRANINIEVINFLKTLFNCDGEKYEVNIHGIKYKHTSLWNYILSRVKTHYALENKDIFEFCEPKYLSLPSLFNSIQYHTGLVINIPVINSTKFSNKDLINRDFGEDSIIEIKAKCETFKFRSFLVNSYVHETNRNTLSLYYDDFHHQKILMRYLSEKYQKCLSTFTWTYLHFCNSLRSMDPVYSKEFSIVEYLTANDQEFKEKFKDHIFYDYYKTQFSQLAIKFEAINYLFLQLLEPFVAQTKEDNLTTTLTPQSNKNIFSTTIDYQSAIDYISEYWFSKHPYISLLNLLMARLNRRSKSDRYQADKIQKYYKESLLIAKESLGTNNLFVASLCEEIGSYYISLKMYLEGIRHLIITCKVFKDYKEEFLESYMRNLKRITKYYIILGYYKDSLEFGTELVHVYLNSYFKKNKPLKDFNIDGILINLIRVAKSLNNQEAGIEFCKILINDLRNNKIDTKHEFIIKDWRGKKKKNLNNEDNGREVLKLKHLIKIYLKLIIRNLKDNDRSVYIQSLVKLLENKKEKESLEYMGNDIDHMFNDIFTLIKEEGDLNKFFARIILNISLKYDHAKSYQKTNDSTAEIEKNFFESWNRFKMLYKLFRENKVFVTSFMDTDIFL